MVRSRAASHLCGFACLGVVIFLGLTNGSSAGDACGLSAFCVEGQELEVCRRGDANCDGFNFGLTGDDSYIYGYLVLGDISPPACSIGADVNDDGLIDISDVIYRNRPNVTPKAPAFPPPGPFLPGCDPTPGFTPSPPLAELALGFDCPQELAGPPGARVRFEIFATLTTRENQTQAPPQGWSISLGADNLTIISITTENTEVPQPRGSLFCDGYSEVVDPNLDTGSGAQGQGAVSFVLLPLGNNDVGGQTCNTLLPEGTIRIASIVLEASIPEEGSTAASLFYRDGKQGSGQPVTNVITLTDVDRVIDVSQTPSLASCAIRLVPRNPSPEVLRGDCDGDGDVRGVVTDAVFLLNFNFLGGTRPSCFAACDANADGQVSGVVTDAVYLLTFNFLGGPPPPEPFPGCGPGTEADTALGCETPSASCGGQR